MGLGRGPGREGQGEGVEKYLEVPENAGFHDAQFLPHVVARVDAVAALYRLEEGRGLAGAQPRHKLERRRQPGARRHRVYVSPNLVPPPPLRSQNTQNNKICKSGLQTR